MLSLVFASALRISATPWVERRILREPTNTKAIIFTIYNDVVALGELICTNVEFAEHLLLASETALNASNVYKSWVGLIDGPRRCLVTSTEAATSE